MSAWAGTEPSRRVVYLQASREAVTGSVCRSIRAIVQRLLEKRARGACLRDSNEALGSADLDVELMLVV